MSTKTFAAANFSFVCGSNTVSYHQGIAIYNDRESQLVTQKKDHKPMQALPKT